MNLNINSKKSAVILFVSILLSFSYNYFSPEGIPLIAEEKKIEWAEDSTLFSDKKIIKEDTLALAEVGTSNQDDEIEIPRIKNSAETDFVEMPLEIDSLNESSAVENMQGNDLPDENTQVKPELTEPKAINLEQAYKLFEAGILFIDAREPEDYKNAHIRNSINLPMDHFDDYKFVLEKLDKNQPVVTYCAGTDCDLSIVLGNVLFDMGFKKIFVFFGGWNEWAKADYPTESLNQ